MLSETEKAYFAGFFDGDGCVLIHCLTPENPRSFVIRVQIAQNDHSILYELKDIFGGGVHGHTRKAKQWTLSGLAAADFLEQIAPYLRLKRKEAEFSVSFERGRPRLRGHGVPEEEYQRRLRARAELQEMKQHRGRG